MNNNSFILLNFIISILILISNSKTLVELNSPIVELTNGKVKGFKLKLENTGVGKKTRIPNADIFLGIPYAQPPIGDLRLEKPKPALNWSGILDATNFGSPCVPLHILGAIDYSEDCLFLNIFRPSDVDNPVPKKLYPVVVFIHGGGFSLGGNFVEGYQNISNNFVSRGVIIITIQYRLGLLGFFSDGSKELPGNLGIWDQNQALKWINKNIKYFRGDPNRITLSGQSAGSASVSFHAISPKSRDLFQQTIEQSGNWISKWAFNDRVIETSKLVANEFNCTLSDSKLLKKCMKDLQILTILIGMGNLDLVRNEFEFLIFNPRMDGDFFPSIPEILIKQSPPKPSLIGFNTDESIFEVIVYPDTIFAFESPFSIKDWEKYDRNSLIEFINEKIQPINSNFLQISKSQLKLFCNELIEFYVEKEWKKIPQMNSTKNSTLMERNYRFYLQRYIALLTDIQFLIPSVWEARLKSKYGWPVYIYNFDYINPSLIKQLPFRAIVHGGEYPFTFGIHTFGSFKFGKREWQLRNKIADGFVNFNKHGYPGKNSTPSITYNAKTISENFKIARLGTTEENPLILENEPEWLMARIRFWDKLAKNYDLSKIKGLPYVNKNF